MTSALLNDRYNILRIISKGGFGETFLAEDTQMPSGRYCVVKLLKPTNNDPKTYQIIQERFQREAAILEELGEGQPQIPSLYAYFESGGEFYLVQEYIEGKTLNQQLQQQGIFSESRIRDLLINLLPTLAYIHDKRIIHRDIKPDNIILRSSDNKPVLIDFGAVRETMGTVMTSSGTPTSSIVIGTPGFMPSEQSIGRPVFSSDLYSLGLTAIYLLTGKVPQALTTDPLTGEIVWRELALNISPSLGDILDKTVKSHARDRFSTAREMLAALQSENVSSSPTVAFVPPVQVPPIQIPSATIAVAPTSAPKQSNNNTIISSLIIGGLACFGIIAGLILTRPSAVESEQSKDSKSGNSQQNPQSSQSNNLQNNSNFRDRPDPRETVTRYYSYINSEQYESAWQMLPSSIKNDPRLHPDGYVNYYNWWDSVDRVAIKNVNLVDSRSDASEVNISYDYQMKKGNFTPQTLRFSLVWDESQDDWAIAKIKVL
ncbi:serine/threonine-protein kinase [Spirulina sp. 06S082]|uniref:serine/threonine-protein kinase n=1 Tax=Spirulina sp. 06S082 TaxID=3110248 RepID=UPI002B1F9F09|nr:serine/threonine-protein kinase [Spirulina sp. 06S082]MEA5469727.1 serine/threonine-protein kinase [Spirulina sp. 06S082]